MRLSFIVTVVAAVVFGACGPTSVVPSPSPTAVRLYRGGTLVYSDGLDLWASAPDGTDRRQLTRDGTAGFYAGGRWSPDGRLIAAEREVPGESGFQLFLVDPSDHSSRRLSPAGTWLDGFDWSPDGTRIVYSTLTSGGTLGSGGTLQPEKGEVWSYSVVAGTRAMVGPGVHPAWSPDGARVAYVHAAGAIAVSAPDGSDIKWVATLRDLERVAGNVARNGFRFLGAPAWSRDGRQLAFPGIEGGPILDALQVVFVAAPVAASPLRPYAIGTAGAQHHVANLVWSPTADILAYASILAEPHHHALGLIDPRRDRTQPLFDSRSHFLYFAWAPDGSHLLLEVDDDRAFALIRVDRSEPDPPRLDLFGFRPDWCCRRSGSQ